MEDKLYIGIDNGVTGTVGCIYNTSSSFFQTPIKKQQNYTKKKANISRVDFLDLIVTVDSIVKQSSSKAVMCLIERPMVNPKRFKATTSALRALEATLNVVEYLHLPYAYIDSKEWQKELLPQGSKDLKSDSKDIGQRLFPEHKTLIEKHGDADGILIAEYCRRKY